MSTLKKSYRIIIKRFAKRFTVFFSLSLLLGTSMMAQSRFSFTEMPVRDKYAFIAWGMKQKGLLEYESSRSSEYVDFSALLLRDVFPEKRQSLLNVLQNNDSEFGRKMFVDSIKKLVKTLEPVPFNKKYVVAVEASLSEYDFNTRRFQVYLDTDKKFISSFNKLFREQVSLLQDKYKEAAKIPIPFGFTDPRIPSYNDKFSVYGKGWHYIYLPPDSAQRLVEKINTESGNNKTRKIHALIEYAPVLYEDQVIATNVLGISYFLDGNLTRLITEYPEVINSKASKVIAPETMPTASPIFADLPFLRTLEQGNDKARFVVYKGVLESGNELLNGKECYHSAVYGKYQETAPDKYVQVLALRSDFERPLISKFWIQIGAANNPLWTEGYMGLRFTNEMGKFGWRIGFGSEILVKAPKAMDKFEFNIFGIDKQQYSGTVDRLLVVYDKRGKEIATSKLKPITGDLSTVPITSRLKFEK